MYAQHKLKSRTIVVLSGAFLTGVAPPKCRPIGRGGGKAVTGTLQAVFDSTEEASARIIGDGQMLLDVVVLDQEGNLVAADTDAEGVGVCVVRWTPRAAGVFTIKVRELRPAARDLGAGALSSN